MFVGFFIFLFVRFILSNSQCLNYDDVTKMCDFCSYSFYSKQNQISKNLSDEKFKTPPNECAKKNLTSIIRSILIVNLESYQKNDYFFDDIYFDILEGFLNENLVIKKYFSSKIIVGNTFRLGLTEPWST